MIGVSFQTGEQVADEMMPFRRLLAEMNSKGFLPHEPAARLLGTGIWTTTRVLAQHICGVFQIYLESLSHSCGDGAQHEGGAEIRHAELVVMEQYSGHEILYCDVAELAENQLLGSPGPMTASAKPACGRWRLRINVHGCE